MLFYCGHKPFSTDISDRKDKQYIATYAEPLIKSSHRFKEILVTT